jgi:glycerophosphoryl diester phosphodiesterase
MKKPIRASAADWSLPPIIAHRGASRVAPENTLAAIARAADAGARAVELDVALSADGVPVILHDETLNRTTDGRGSVARKTLADLRTLDAGAWFGKRFKGERLPTLAEAVALILERKMGLNLEIKPTRGAAAATAENAIGVLKSSWPGKAPLVISSGSAVSLDVARDVAPYWPRGLILDAVPPDWADRLAATGCVSLHCNARSVTPSLVEEVHEAGYRLLAWTVNRLPTARRLFRAGVDGIFTDDPAKMIAAFAA